MKFREQEGRRRTRSRSRSSWRAIAVVSMVGFASLSSSAPAGAEPVDTAGHDAERHDAERHDPRQPVLDWSREAQDAIVLVAQKFPGDAALLMGIVHTAIYDATIAVEGGFRPYLVDQRAPDGTSLTVTVATAAHHVLAGLFPEQREGQDGLDARYEAYLAGIADGDGKTDGIAVGARIGGAILVARADDGRIDEVPYEQQPPGPGVYEPTGPVVVGTTLAQVHPLVLASPSQFRPNGPPPLTGRRYGRDFTEVATLGRADSDRRNDAQTDTALFWTDHDVAQWNRGLHRFAIERDFDAAQTAHLLVATHVAGADAMIACFDAKYHYLFWRPVHAIVRADTDDNSTTEADAGWAPLRPTPPHPEYPSAHACHATAVVTVLNEIAGRGGIDITLDNAASGQTRTYHTASDVVTDVNNARIWAGFHFRFSTDDGTRIGRRVGRYVTTHAFRRIDRDPCEPDDNQIDGSRVCRAAGLSANAHPHIDAGHRLEVR